MKDIIDDLKAVLQNLEEAKYQIAEQQEEIRNTIAMLMAGGEEIENG